MAEFIAQNLVNGEREARMEAANALCSLTNKEKRELAEKGVIPPLIFMLQSQDYEAVQASLFGLLSLAFGSDRNKIRIVKSGAVPVLVEVLRLDSKVLVELGVAAVLILSSCTNNKLEIANSGVIQILIHIMNLDIVGFQAKLDSIATLHNLSTHRQIIPLMVDSGAMFVLLRIICFAEKSSILTEKAISVLESVVSCSSQAVKEVGEVHGGIRVLVEEIEEGNNPQCKEHAVAILLQICKSCREKYRGLILKEGVMPGLLQLSVDGTSRAKEMARNLLLLLRDCSSFTSTSSGSKHSKREIVKIMKEIDSEIEKIPGRTLRLVEEMIAKLRT